MKFPRENPSKLSDKILDQIDYFTKNPRFKEKLVSTDIGKMQCFIVQQMDQENGDALCEAFVQNLKLFNDLHEKEMADHYMQIAQSMCDVLLLPNVQHAFLDQITTVWLKQMEYFPATVKSRVFNHQLKKFKAIAKIIPKLGLLQSRVLEILYTHLDTTPEKFIEKLFDDVVGESCKESKDIDQFNNQEKYRLMYTDLLKFINRKNVQLPQVDEGANKTEEDDTEMKNIVWDVPNRSIFQSTPYPSEMNSVMAINNGFPKLSKNTQEIMEFFEPTQDHNVGSAFKYTPVEKQPVKIEANADCVQLVHKVPAIKEVKEEGTVSVEVDKSKGNQKTVVVGVNEDNPDIKVDDVPGGNTKKKPIFIEDEPIVFEQCQNIKTPKKRHTRRSQKSSGKKQSASDTNDSDSTKNRCKATSTSFVPLELVQFNNKQKHLTSDQSTFLSEDSDL
ncbi:uncharacterized protein LOC116338229 [Contarinia nasturtii]|uniref:uncharacterized protein LOC116338229 n=1 Tax=Contarinia nasturtii TaxID=265458 RepID=UPI0012D410A4|nr:uncharacterized protein LOC116338229 [Contarinia nasturtii]